ncbi:sensor histidine kinase [Butyricicoccus sp. Marseille-Q5471]|uniref:sensor histidine kinase n=1 Tax=Butyricicoccus sp. Marseille-Q5471 TaxID=3039493 RepID=UPI0024BC9E0D|nr:sensor histidine kinase [Butyricicoccus sp. Marseille-Q5471]
MAGYGNRQGVRSIGGMLRQSLFKIILCMAVPLVLLAGLLVGLTLRYDAVIADASQAAEMSNVLEQRLPDQIWKVISGRISFAEGTQGVLLSELKSQLAQMQQHSEGEERRYLNAAMRATETLDGYIGQLERQTTQHAAVSRNENLYREIYSVAQLTSSMIDRYVEAKIVRMGQLNSGIQKVMLLVVVLLIALIGLMIRTAVRTLRTVDRSIREPIFRLEGMASRIAQGDLSARVPPAEIAELYRLTGDLNAMAAQIDRLIGERVEQEQIAKKAELRALQAQITPHFVYNTLETVVWLAEEGRNREVVEMTMAFTDFLRISLSRGQDYITVEKEAQHVYSYLMIQSVRYGSIMQYEIDIDPSLSGCRMLKLMLQPLVENAIYHGVKQKRGRGMIRVTGRRAGDRMRFSVEDNGMGMKHERLEALRRSLRDPNAPGGYGLRNVEQRLRLYYHTGLAIESEYRVGTTVHFCLPCDMAEET